MPLLTNRPEIGMTRIGVRATALTVLFTLAILAGGCVSVPRAPERLGLQLAPAALGTSISLHQHLRLERDGRTDHFDAALEVDAQHVSMIGLALGQRMLSLDYDGAALTQWRHALLPAHVRAEDVLEDIQLTYWPAAAIRAALPAGWRLDEHGRQRTLWSNGTLVVQIDYSAQPRWHGTITLSNLRHQYRLVIQSVSSDQ